MGRKSNFDTYLSALKLFYASNKCIPNFQNATNVLGLKSKASVHKFYNQLYSQGYLSKDGKRFLASNKMTSLPLFESIRAGMPTNATGENRRDINIQDFLVERPGTTVLLKVKGGSMINEGILDGDIVVVDTSIQCNIYDIVIAIVDGDYTMKYLMKDKKGITYLKAANDQFPDIYPRDELQIYGVVTGVIRKYR